MPKELPSDLQSLNRWLVWKSEERDGKPTKVPYNARTGQRAAVDDPSSWSTFAEAQEAAQAGIYTGLGFVLGNGVAGIDLDHCRNAETGAIEPWAQRIINTVDTYTEVSPSGTGVHLIFFGTLPAGRRRFGRVEMYDDKRFFTITGEIVGNHVAPCPRAAVVHETWTDLNDVHEFIVWAKSNKQSKVLEYWQGFKDENRSDGDNAVVHALIAFTKRDSARVDRLFRLSGRMRPKWDEVHHADGSTYGQGTIKAALAKAAASATSDEPLALVPRWWVDLKKNPPIQPKMLVERLMLAADINMIAGASYAGKSTIALDLAVSIATGVDALGKFKVPQAGRVLYVYAEHHEGAWWSNLQRVAEYRGFEDALDLPIGLLAGYKMSLAKPADLAALVALIQKWDVKTIILDPLSTLTTVEGDSENDASAVIRSARKPLQILVQDTGVSVIVIHHATKMYLRVEPFSAKELVRGSGDLMAMTGSILGVWAYTDPKERGMVKMLPDVRGPQAGIFRCGPRGAAPVERAFGVDDDPSTSFEPLGFFDWHSNMDRNTPEQQTLQVLMEQPGGVASPDVLISAIGKSRATVMRHLTLLVEQGLVEHTGTGTYRVKREAAPGAEPDESLL